MNGLIKWMTENSVAANLLMLLLMVGGLYSALDMKQEVFPEFDPDSISISVSYPGASPEDVEQGVLLPIENAVSGLEGVDEMTSRASEGSGSVTLELLDDADIDEVLEEADSAVRGISTFPDDAETAEVSKGTRRHDVLTVMVSGQQDARVLHELALDLQDELTDSSAISVVEVSGLPSRVLEIEISQQTLQALDMTLDDVATAVNAGSQLRGAGTLKTADGDLSVRIDDRKLSEQDFAAIPIQNAETGATVVLGDIATIVSGYDDTSSTAWMNGEKAVKVGVYRVGAETPGEVSAATREVIAEFEERLPDTVHLTILNDSSQILDARLELLGKNAAMGLVLVLAILAMFLDLRTAVWVSMGIPISFLGAFLLMPVWGVTINMISLFAFLVVLGLVVDDAIVVGEQVFYEREQGGSGTEAAVRGATRMLAPVTVAVLTTVAAFAPISSIPGMFGSIFGVFPLVIIAVLGMSMLESFLILPAHLSHGGDAKLWKITDPLRERFSALLARFISGPYQRMLSWGIANRVSSFAIAFFCVAVSAGAVAGGWVPVQFFPDISGERVTATVRLPPGTSEAEVQRVRALVEDAGRGATETLDLAQYLDGINAVTADGDNGSEEITINMNFSAEAALDTEAIGALWSQGVPDLGPESTISMRATMGPSAGEAVNVALSHTDLTVTEAAVSEVMELLRSYADLTNVETSLSEGTDSLEVSLSEPGEAMGLRSESLGAQVRAAFSGAEAFKEIDGRTERTVRARLPESERLTAEQVSGLQIQVADGAWAPLETVANVEPSVAPSTIERVDGRRQVSVTADLVEGVASSDEVTAALIAQLPGLEERYPGLEARMRGQYEERQESSDAMGGLFGLSLLGIYALLAATFRSYTQPVVVMTVIPFSIVGAVFGHFIVGLPLSMISAFGIIALAGVVVNDSLVLVDAANELRQQGYGKVDAIRLAGQRRFRPILLTSLTTFLGLAPMILETSVQAQFLIPMAVSLGFGILVATAVVLLLVPVIFLVVDDTVEWMTARWSALTGSSHPALREQDA